MITKKTLCYEGSEQTNKQTNKQVPKEIQLYCWKLIDKKRSEAETELYYLQIFEFNPDDQRQAIEIIHRQEE